MPQFVRAGLRYNRWIETGGLDSLDFPADVLTDLKTSGDTLSVYEVSESVSAERIAIAVAAGKSDAAQTAYAVFEREAVERLGIIPVKTPGDTIDSTVNGHHYDLPVGRALTLLELAEVIARSEPIPILKKVVTQLLKEGFESGRLDYTKNRRLADKVNAHLNPSEEPTVTVDPERPLT